MKKALVLPPTRHAGSMGDQAMCWVVFERLSALGYAVEYPDLGERFSISGCNSFRAQLFAENGPLRSIVNRIYLILQYFRRLFDRRTILFVIGADAVETPYFGILILLIARCLGRTIWIFGFSFQSKPSNISAIVLKMLKPSQTTFLCRDESSLANFTRITGHRAGLVADLAYLLNPIAVTDVALKSFLDQIPNDRLVIIVPALRRGFTRESMVEAFCKVVNTTYKNYWIIVVTHDRRDSNDRICKAVFDKIQTANKYAIDYCDARMLRTVMQKSALVVSMLMHPCIGALTVGVPVLGCSYNEKTKGAFDLLGLSDWTFDSPDSLADRSATIVAALPILRSKINGALPKIREMANENFTGL